MFISLLVSLPLVKLLWHPVSLPRPGCTGVTRVHADRNLSNHPPPNEILKRPWHPSGSPGCWGATPVAVRGEPQWNLDSQVNTPMIISNSNRPGCTQWKFPDQGEPRWKFFLLGCTPVEFLNSTGAVRQGVLWDFHALTFSLTLKKYWTSAHSELLEELQHTEVNK